jgi:hypothetical protein
MVSHHQPAMKPRPPVPKQTLEDDAVWELLGQVPRTQPAPNFVSNTVRTARLLGQETRLPWWKKLFAPAPLAGLAAACAAVALAVHLLQPVATQSPGNGIAAHNAQAIQEVAEAELLLAASEDFTEFSDQELACLLGF